MQILCNKLDYFDLPFETGIHISYLYLRKYMSHTWPQGIAITNDQTLNMMLFIMNNEFSEQQVKRFQLQEVQKQVNRFQINGHLIKSIYTINGADQSTATFICSGLAQFTLTKEVPRSTSDLH